MEQSSIEREETLRARKAVKALGSLRAGDRYITYANRHGYYWIYLIGNKEHSYYKIGISKWPEQRLVQLQIMPFPVELYAAVSACSDSDLSKARRIEKEMHTIYKGMSLRGEWFHFVDTDDFLSTANVVIKGFEQMDQPPSSPQLPS